MSDPTPDLQCADTDPDLLPVVDENDEQIDVLPRREVHLRGLRHRAVHVILFDGRGRLWLQRRALSKDTWPGAWDLAATGHVDVGESYDDAAARELREELNIEGRPQFVAKIPASERTGWEFHALYAMRWDERIREFNKREITQVKLFTVDAVELLLDGGDPRMPLTPGVEDALPYLAQALPERLRADHPRRPDRRR